MLWYDVASPHTAKRGNKRRGTRGAPTAREGAELAWLTVEGVESKRDASARAEVEVTIVPVTTTVPVMVVVESSSGMTLLIVASVGRAAMVVGVEGVVGVGGIVERDPLSMALIDW